MAKPRILPSNQELKKMVDQGMTHQEIAEHVTRTTGEVVQRSAISAALSRAGLAEQGKRYKDEIPWKVKTEHLTQYPARMLRLLGRRNQGLTLTGDEEQRLESWLDLLHEEGAVVAYAPEGPGFMYVVADEKHDGLRGIPIRSRTIGRDELS